jgi:hypothetical protein
MKQAPIRLVAIDVDGTLLDSSHRLQKSVGEALEELHVCGVIVVLATARSPQLLRSMLRELNSPPLLVCFFGSLDRGIVSTVTEAATCFLGRASYSFSRTFDC